MDFDNKANSIVQLIKEVHPFINSKNIDNKTCIFIVHISRSFTFKSRFILKEPIVNRCAVSVLVQYIRRHGVQLWSFLSNMRFIAFLTSCVLLFY